MARVISAATQRGKGRRRTAWAFVIALNALATSPAWAGRPLTTEDTGTLDPGKVELELSLDYIRDGAGDIFLLPGGPALNIDLLLAEAAVLVTGRQSRGDGGHHGRPVRALIEEAVL
ncbi:MAG: hypothetical protein HYW08_03210, partial [candidate division NC10 bacterium]|nr:hypothetical protein [candidate division NC10 bacterium]